MTKRVQMLRYTTAALSAITPLAGEQIIDTTKKVAVIGDGTTAGGIPQAREDLSNVAAATVVAKINGETVAALEVTELTTPELIAELMTVDATDIWKKTDMGIEDASFTVGLTTTSVIIFEIDDDLDITMASPGANYEYSKKFRIEQGATGGTPTFKASDGTAATWPNDDEPDWATETITRCVAIVESASVVRMFLGG